MPKKLLLLATLLLFCLTAAASPARRTHIVLTQPDGTRIEAILSGDEFHKILTTASGQAIALAEDGYYHYIHFTPEGYREATPWKAGDAATPADVLAKAAQIPHEAVARLAATRRSVADNGRERRRLTNRAEGFPAERRVLVIPVQFSDLKYRYSQDDLILLLDGETPTSAKTYFNDQFSAVGTEFHVDVAPIVTLPNRYAYYGKNDTSGADTNPHLMVRDACQGADAYVDFSQYDSDGDGTVDNVFIFYAGGDEAEGAGDDHVWSHQWYLKDGAGLTLRLDGVLINSYACTSELMYTSRGTTTLTSIGTFCHEFSHTLGLPDYYDTDYEDSDGISEGLWGSLALMDNGNRNDGGQTPPWYNAVDRYLLGLIEPKELAAGEQRLSPIHQAGEAFILETDKSGEYYLFECRSNEGWDAAIGGSGLLIYHIDRSTNTAGSKTAAARWKDNSLNCYPMHPCVDLVEADPSIAARFVEARAAGTLRDLVPRAFFPQAEQISFTPNTQPAFLFWSGTPSGLSLSDIRFDGTDVVFTVSGSEVLQLPEIATLSGEVFQDGAILGWTTDIEEYYGVCYLSYGPTGKNGEEIEIRPYEPGHYAYIIEGLTPKTAYTAKVYFKSGGSPVNSRSFNFTTKSIYAGSRPFIILPKTDRNSDGSFAAGARIPLRIYNLPDGVSVSWLLDGESVMPDGSGYFTLERSGELKAILVDENGAEDILLKTLTVR